MSKKERDPSMTKVMPNDSEAEKALLCGLMQSNDAIADALEIISRNGDEFYYTANKLMFQAIISLVDYSTPADMVTVASRLEENGNLAKAGGHAYISSVIDVFAPSTMVSHYAEMVKAKAVERTIISESSRLIETAYNPAMTTEDILQEAQRTILSLSLGKEENTMQSAYEIAKRTHKLIEERYEQKGGVLSGVPTRFTEIDEMTGGMNPGDLWIIAARPGMGKSALAVDIAFHAALSGYKGAIFSLEMPKDSLMIRILSSMCRIDSRLLSKGLIAEDQWFKLSQAAAEISEAPLYIDDKAAITPTEIMAKCRKLKGDKGLDLVVVDYLQLMKIPGFNESREQTVAEISRSMKMLARDLNIPVIALSQLNRQVEQRTDKRPGLGDLRESGAIEQDADLVAFIYRDDMYNKSDDNPRKGIAEIMIEKHRNGKTGTVELAYLEKYTRFENLATTTWEEGKEKRRQGQ